MGLIAWESSPRQAVHTLGGGRGRWGDAGGAHPTPQSPNYCRTVMPVREYPGVCPRQGARYKWYFFVGVSVVSATRQNDPTIGAPCCHSYIMSRKSSQLVVLLPSASYLFRNDRTSLSEGSRPPDSSYIQRRYHCVTG